VSVEHYSSLFVSLHPVVSSLVSSDKTALQAYAPELAPEIELGSKALQGGTSKQLSKQGMGIHVGLHTGHTY